MQEVCRVCRNGGKLPAYFFPILGCFGAIFRCSSKLIISLPVNGLPLIFFNFFSLFLSPYFPNRPPLLIFDSYLPYGYQVALFMPYIVKIPKFRRYVNKELLFRSNVPQAKRPKGAQCKCC